MSRVAGGWVDAGEAAPLTERIDDMDETDGLTAAEIESIMRLETAVRPYGMQQTVEAEAVRWGREWCVHEEPVPLTWPGPGVRCAFGLFRAEP